jgi:hypothetical protein
MRLFFVLLLLPATLYAQGSADSIAKGTDFTIPASPAFTLLDANPCRVTRPSFTKDFRLDWIIKEGKLVSDIAIDAQPIWLLFYQDVNLQEYRAKDEINRILSTITLSVGTAEKDSIRSLAWALKVNVYRSRDPLLDTAYINALTPRFSDRERKLRLRLAGIQDALAEEEFPEEQRDSLELLNETISADLDRLRQQENDRVKEIEEEYTRVQWNASLVDIAFGRLYSYSSPSIDSLHFISSGFGAWVNGAFGVGQSWLLSALLQFGEREGEPSRMLGANIRYGNGSRNFFLEYVFESAHGEKRHTISYGGEFKASDNLAIQFSLRTDYDRSFNIGKLIPLINLNWRLTKGLFQ